jgi:hypothetical protein
VPKKSREDSEEVTFKGDSRAVSRRQLGVNVGWEKVFDDEENLKLECLSCKNVMKKKYFENKMRK